MHAFTQRHARWYSTQRQAASWACLNLERREQHARNDCCFEAIRQGEVQVYAYTSSPVMRGVLDLFVRCEAVLPNLYIGTLTRYRLGPEPRNAQAEKVIWLVGWTPCQSCAQHEGQARVCVHGSQSAHRCWLLQCRDTVTSALLRGLPAKQLLTFLRLHAHPRAAQRSPVVPEASALVSCLAVLLGSALSVPRAEPRTQS